MDIDLGMTNKISQRYKDIVFGFIKEIQSIFPTNNGYYKGDNLVKHMILLYFYRAIQSKIFNHDEKEALRFMDILKQNNKRIVDYPWRLLYDSRKEGKGINTFYEKVGDESNLLVLIQLNREFIVGGYTRTGWKKDIYKSLGDYDEKWVADKDAFVFYFKSPKNFDPYICNVKQDDDSISHAICHSKHYYATFGKSSILYVSDFSFSQFIDTDSNFDPYPHHYGYLTGERNAYNFVHEFEIEVFKVTL